MGWRTKQVSSEVDGSDWTPSSLQDHGILLVKREHPQRQSTATISSSEQVKCPRCGSTNTKFCYYNNYNKSQPRHFCKSCKRHWTKGGTLRNVPVGGIRKNKRPRTKTSPSATSTTVSHTSSAGERGERVNWQKHQKLIFPQPSPLLKPTFRDNSSAADHSVLQGLDNQFPWSGSSPFEVSSWQHPILTGTATTPMSLICHQPWTLGSDFPETADNNMNWDELDTLVSANLNFPWDDVDIKLP